MATRRAVKDEAGHLIGWVVWDTLADLVEVEDVMAPAEFHLRLPGDTDQPSLEIKFEVRNGAPFCAGIQVDAKPKGREVLANDMEVIRRQLGQWSHAAFTCVAMEQEPMEPPLQGWTALSLAEDVKAHKAFNGVRRRRKITDRLLEEVASLYRDNIDEGAWQAIRERFGVSKATAGRYVMLARKAGYLPDTTPGQKKA